MNSHDLSEQMRAVLHLLDTESPVPLCQLYQHLYEATRHQPRRAFDASLSRTIRRLEQRGLVSREGDTIVMTQYGRWAIHPEEYQAVLEEIRQSVSEAVKRAAAECPELQKAKRGAMDSEARWEEIFKANGWR